MNSSIEPEPNCDSSVAAEPPEEASPGVLPYPVRLLTFGLLNIAVQIGVAIVVAMIAVVYFLAAGTITSPGDVEQLEVQLNNNLALITAVSAIPITALTFGVCYFCRRHLDKRRWQTMGFVKPQWSGSGGLLMAMTLGTLPILIATGIIVGAGGYLVGAVRISAFTIAMVPALFCLAFTEEIMFRGYILQNLVDAKRTMQGIIVSSIAFWLVHGMNPGAWESPIISLNLFLAGVILAQAYLVSGDIWYPTVLHFGWNFAQGVVLSIPVSGMKFPGIVNISVVATSDRWLTGGEFGLEGSLVVSMLEVVLIIVMQSIIKQRATSIATDADQLHVDDV